MLEIVDRPMPSVPARAYVMKACGDQDAPEVIASIISLYGIEMHALIDLGSTHSYVCVGYIKVHQLYRVLSPLAHVLLSFCVE